MGQATPSMITAINYGLHRNDNRHHRAKIAEQEITVTNERFELISSASSNDAIFELNFVTGKSWRNKVFREMLYEEGDNLSIKEKKNFVALCIQMISKSHKSIEDCYADSSEFLVK
jgi:hypothetical protein